MPTDWRSLLVFAVALIIIAIVAVFLFQNIIDPLLNKVT
jgi:hypothetical protein